MPRIRPDRPTTPRIADVAADSVRETPRGRSGRATRTEDTFNPAAADARTTGSPVASLGTFGGKQVVMTQEGRLGIGAAPKDRSEEIAAIRAAVSHAPNGQPLAALTDPATLRAVSASASKLFQGGLAAPRNDSEATGFRQARAAALELMDAAARRASELGDAGAKAALTDALLQAIAQEPHLPLRDFSYEKLIARAKAGELSIPAAVSERLYPTRPPYERWLEDGKIKFVYYTDNDGSFTDDNAQLFSDLGFERTDHPDGSVTFFSPADGDEAAIEVCLQPPPKDERPALFEHMDSPDVDVIVYVGHSGYGRRVEDALLRGVKGTGADKAVVLMQCTGEATIGSIRGAYPHAQIISTRAGTYDELDQALIRSMMLGFKGKESWPEVRERTISWVKNWGGYGGFRFRDFPVEEHYFYPHDREVILAKTDRDGDGVRDNGDTLFNVITPKRTDAAGGYDPLDPGAPLDSLSGSAFSQATNRVNLIGRYCELPAEVTRAVPWGPEMFVPDGFFDPEGDTRAFRFELDAATQKVRVKLSGQFAHASSVALERMLAYEAGLWIGARAGLDAAGAAALGLSFLERAVHQQGHLRSVWDVLERSAFQEAMFRRRYGLPVGFDELSRITGDPEDFTAEHFQALRSYAASKPAIAALTTRTPGRASEPLAFPEGMRVMGNVGTREAKTILGRLGVEETLDDFSGVYVGTGDASRVYLPVVGAEGKKAWVVLALDDEGRLVAASRLEQPAAGD